MAFPLCASSISGEWQNCRLRTRNYHNPIKRYNLQLNGCLKMGSNKMNEESKLVWIWTQNKQVMTTAVERGWHNFVFDINSENLAKDWSSIALINPLYIKDGALLDTENRSIASFFEISSPQQLDQMLLKAESENTVIHLLDWQVIPAENIIAAIQGIDKRVIAVAETFTEAQNFLEALEHGLGGVVLKVQDIDPVLKLKEYLDRKSEVSNCLTLIIATVNRVHMVGMGDRVCVDLCTLMKPGEGLLVGSFARGLFLVHSECLETDYISSRPFRVNAGPVHSYVAVPGGKTCYLSELKAGKEVLVVNQNGQQRTAIVGRVKIETRPLVLVEAKGSSSDQSSYSILLQNAETVGFVSPSGGQNSQRTAVPVTSLKVGDEILLRVQGGARHTGIEIQEFIVEKNFMQLVFSGGDAGGILKYDPVTQETIVLLKDVQFPNGISLSKDGSFFLFCGGSVGRLSRYWLLRRIRDFARIPRQHQDQQDGDIWMALHFQHSWSNYLLETRPRLRDFLLRLPIKTKYQFMVFIGGWPHGIIMKYSPEGKLLQILEDGPGKVAEAGPKLKRKTGNSGLAVCLLLLFKIWV